MNTQVPLLNSLVRFEGRVNSELVGSMCNMERMQFSQFNSMHKVETPSNISYLLLFPSRCQNRRMFLARIAECLGISPC